MSKKSTISSKHVHCCIHVSRVFFLLGCCPILYVRTWYVWRDPVSYIVRAYLVSYRRSVRQQQRFDHPTLKPTSVLLLGCIKNSTISSKHVYCCINKHTNRRHLHGHVDKKKGKHKNKNLKKQEKKEQDPNPNKKNTPLVRVYSSDQSCC